VTDTDIEDIADALRACGFTIPDECASVRHLLIAIRSSPMFKGTDADDDADPGAAVSAPPHAPDDRGGIALSTFTLPDGRRAPRTSSDVLRRQAELAKLMSAK
jgi:hypothetical protein